MSKSTSILVFALISILVINLRKSLWPPYRLFKKWLPYVVALGCSFYQVNATARSVQFERISTEQGLTQANITAMVQDHKGYVWIGTQEGLNRYDGYVFETFEHDPLDQDSIGNDWIWSLVVDHKGQLWVGTNNGLSRYDEDNNRFVNYQHAKENPDGLTASQVRYLFEGSDHMIWIATNGGGLSRLDPELNKFTHYRHDPLDVQSLPNDSVNFVYEWKKSLLVGTDSGMAVLDSTRSRFRRQDTVGASKIRVIREHLGQIWIGTHNSGVKILDPISGAVTTHEHIPDDSASLPDNLIRDILIDHQNTVWVATDKGLAEWADQPGRFHSYVNNPLDQYSLSDNRVDSLFLDDGNVLWVGTYGGINRWNYVSDAFHYFHAGSDHLSNDLITSIAEGGSGEIWFGTYGTGLNRLAPLEDKSRLYEAAPVLHDELLRDKRIMALAVDDLGDLWIGTRASGLYHFDPDSGVLDHYLHDPADLTSLGSNGVTTIHVTDNFIWVGTYGGGLNRLDVVDNRFTRFTHDPADQHSLGSDRVLALYQDSRNEFWIGTEDGGLNLFHPLEGTFTRFMHDPDNAQSISNNTAWEVYESNDGSLWVGTLAAGLNRWASADRLKGDPIFRHYQKKDGLKRDTVFGILEGNPGEIWLSGNSGLSEFRPGTGDVRHFDRTNGLKGNEFNFGARLKSRDGHLVFGGTTGLVVFNPESVAFNHHAPTVVISAEAAGKARVRNYSEEVTSGSFQLGYTDKVVDFKFSALDFSSPDKNQYRYKLEGFDDQWMNPGDFRRATYTNLAPGDYQFRVRASNNDGVWNDTGATIPFTVSPPLWLTGWAYALYVLIAISALWIFVLVQRKKQRATENMRILLKEVSEAKDTAEAASRVKSDFLATMSHEIRTPMNGVLGMTQLLLHRDIGETERHYVETIKSSGDSLLTLIDDILDFSKIEAGRLELENRRFDLGRMLTGTIELMAEAAREKGVGLRLQLPESINELEVDGDEHRLRQVILNLLSNAIKFTQEGEVTLKLGRSSCSASKSNFMFEVTDTGLGISEENQKVIFDTFTQADGSTTRQFGGTGLGLSISNQLVGLMGGQLGVKSTLGQGATFSFSLALRDHQLLSLPKKPEQEIADSGAPVLPNKYVEASMTAGHENAVKILVAEDNPINQEVVKAMLESLGYSVLLAADGREATHIVAREKVDLILMDYHMPVMDGLQATKAIRELERSDPERNRLPIVALTADIQERIREECKQAGFDDFLSKPFQMEQMQKIIEKSLRKPLLRVVHSR